MNSVGTMLKGVAVTIQLWQWCFRCYILTEIEFNSVSFTGILLYIPMLNEVAQMNKMVWVLEDLGSSTLTGIHICDVSLPEPEGQIKHDSLMEEKEKVAL